jgi:hypothetical protein
VFARFLLQKCAADGLSRKTALVGSEFRAISVWVQKSGENSCGFSLRKSHADWISALHSITENAQA